MAIRNIWSLDPGEAVFAEDLIEEFKDKLDVYFPIKDSGIDLIAVNRSKNRKVLTFQVKTSRYHEKQDHAWHEIKKDRLNEDKKVDFYIFLTYLPNKNNLKSFKKHYIIIPTKNLLQKSKGKKVKKDGKGGKYVYYFRIDESCNKVKVLEVRDSEVDYTKFHDAWQLIEGKI